MKYIRQISVLLLVLLVPAGTLHAEENKSFIPNFLGNIGEDFKYLATSPTRLDTKSALITLGVIGVGGVLYAYDEQIRDFFQRNQSQEADYLAFGAEKLGWQYAIGFVGAYGGVGYLVKNEKMQATGLLALEALTVSSSISMTVKVATGRSRPMRDRGAYSFEPFSGSRSDTAFPSGHATTAFTIAAVFADVYENPWVGVLTYSLAGLVGLERLYDDKHWASDIWAGAVLGTVVGKSVVYLHKKTDGKVSLAPLIEPSTGTYGACIQVKF
ncbi:MAG: phosphatase PAP2 family protein [Desulfobacterales bacterium]|jgi:membrane-associated phospholipid phosphatase